MPDGVLCDAEKNCEVVGSSKNDVVYFVFGSFPNQYA